MGHFYCTSFGEWMDDDSCHRCIFPCAVKEGWVYCPRDDVFMEKEKEHCAECPCGFCEYKED